MSNPSALRRGNTIMIVVVVIACVVVLFVLVVALLLGLTLPALAKARAQAKTLKDATQVKQIHQAWIVSGREHNGVYLAPSLLPGSSDDGTLGSAVDTTANLHSVFIMQQYCTPDIFVGPTEPSAHVSVCDTYDWDVYNVDAGVHWDPAFKADLARTSNVSYASMPLYGERFTTQWQESYDPEFAIIGTRGPRDGKDDPNSITYRIHGPQKEWVGNVVFNDNHTRVVNGFTQPDIGYLDASGAIHADNFYRMDLGPEGIDAILSFIEEMTAEGPILQHD